MAQMVKNLPAMWEIRIWSLGREHRLEKWMATHSSFLAWRIPWTQEPGIIYLQFYKLLGRKVMTNLDSILKSRDITLPTKVRLVKTMVFPVVIYRLYLLDYKESWVPKNWCFWTVMLEKTFESPLDCKEIQPVHPKWDQSWVLIVKADVEAETPILWPPDGKNWLIWKDSVAGKDWRWEEKGTTEDEMVGWHHWLNGHEFEQVPGVGDGQGGLAFCSPWGCKESGTTEQLNWNCTLN